MLASLLLPVQSLTRLQTVSVSSQRPLVSEVTETRENMLASQTGACSYSEP